MGIVKYRHGMGATPGYTPAQQAMADAFAAQFGAPSPAVYVAPTYVAAPSCLDPMGNALADPACVNNLLLPTQAKNQAAANQANYNVDLQNCLNTVPQPPDCYQRTFGLTPVGGYTGGVNVLTPNAPALLAPAAPAIPTPAAPAASLVIPSKAVPSGSTSSASGTSSPAGAGMDTSGGGYVAPQTSFFSHSFAIDGFNIPLWGVAAAALAALLVFKGGR